MNREANGGKIHPNCIPHLDSLFLLCAHGTGALMELKVRESEHSQVFTKRGSFVRWSAQWTVIERRGG